MPGTILELLLFGLALLAIAVVIGTNVLLFWIYVVANTQSEGSQTTHTYPVLGERSIAMPPSKPRRPTSTYPVVRTAPIQVDPVEVPVSGTFFELASQDRMEVAEHIRWAATPLDHHSMRLSQERQFSIPHEFWTTFDANYYRRWVFDEYDRHVDLLAPSVSRQNVVAYVETYMHDRAGYKEWRLAALLFFDAIDQLAFVRRAIEEYERQHPLVRDAFPRHDFEAFLRNNMALGGFTSEVEAGFKKLLEKLERMRWMTRDEREPGWREREAAEKWAAEDRERQQRQSAENARQWSEQERQAAFARAPRVRLCGYCRFVYPLSTMPLCPQCGRSDRQEEVLA